MTKIEDEIIKVAGTQLGVTEATGHNDGPAVETYLASVGLGKGYAWCMAFAYWCAKKAAANLGQKNPLTETGGVLAEWEDDRNEHITEPEQGCLFIIDDGNGNGHTGIVTGVFPDGSLHTIEGNAQPLTSKVLTPSGFKLMGEIKLGEAIIDPEGNESFVIGIFPKGKRRTMEVFFQDGTSVLCCNEHLWKVKRDGKNTYEIINTDDLKFRVNNTQQRFRVPNIEPVEYLGLNKQLLIEPYLLGLLIGDGTLGKSHVGFTNIDEEILECVEKQVESRNQKLVPHVNNSSNIEGNWRIIGNKQEGSLFKNLQELGLSGCGSETKFIPKIYKKASIYDRLFLLRGLMDSDGTIDNIGRCEFTSCSLQLTQDVLELIQSLGGRASLNIKEFVHYTSPTEDLKTGGKKCYRLQNINMPYFNLFNLNRKAKKFKLRDAAWHRKIISVRDREEQEVQCISVSSPSNLYITDNFIPTHNTNNDGSREGTSVLRKTREVSQMVGFLRLQDIPL